MDETVRAWAPGHITGFFSARAGAEDELDRGSLGAGFSLDKGAWAQVRRAQTPPGAGLAGANGAPLTVLWEGRPVEAPVTRALVEAFYQELDRPAPALVIEQGFELPLGAGFGTSAAGALSTAAALARLEGLNPRDLRVARAAHRAELRRRSGLGTVAGAWAGGFELRLRPGAPGRGQVRNFGDPGAFEAVWVSRGPLSTASLLSDPVWQERVRCAGQDLEPRLDRQASEPGADPVAAFLSLARGFTEAVGLLREPWPELLNEGAAAGWPGGQFFFGDGLWFLVPRGAGEACEAWLAARAPGITGRAGLLPAQA